MFHFIGVHNTSALTNACVALPSSAFKKGTMNQEQEDLCDLRRKRGRPTGRNRVPLSLEQRRARNAQYERERRNETAEAMAQLAEAAGCEPSMTNADLLATVISQLQRASKRNSSEDIEELRRINENLLSQIASIESRLESECSELDPTNLDNLKQLSEFEPNSVPQASDPICNYKERSPRKHTKKKKSKTSTSLYHSSNQLTTESKFGNVVTISEPSSVFTFAHQLTVQSPQSQSETEIELGSPEFQRLQDLNNGQEQTAEASLYEHSTNQIELRAEVEPKILNDRYCPDTPTTTDQQSEYWNEDSSESGRSNRSEPLSSLQTNQTRMPATTEAVSLTTKETETQQELQYQSQPMIDLFTDNEKNILSEWLNCNDLGFEQNGDAVHSNYNWSLTDYFTGCI